MSGRLLTQAQCDRLRRLCEVHPIKVAASLVGCSPDTVGKIRKRGWVAAGHRRGLRPRPGDFVIQSAHMTKKQLCEHYRAGDAVVRRWAREINRTPMQPRRIGQGLPIPDDLADIVAKLGPYGAADHYGVHYGTVKKWRRLKGLPISWSRKAGAKRGRKPAPPSQIGWADRYHQENAL